MNRGHDYKQDTDDQLELDTAAVLRELGWVCTLAALPILAAALHPSVFQLGLLADLPSYSLGAQHRFFILGLIVLLLGVIPYIGGVVLPLLRRQGHNSTKPPQ